MTRLTPILEKLAARQQTRKHSEAALDRFIDDMLAIVRTDLDKNGCGFLISTLVFADEGREALFTIEIEFPTSIYEKLVVLPFKIEKLGETYRISSNGKAYQDLVRTAEEAADAFFSVVYHVV